MLSKPWSENAIVSVSVFCWTFRCEHLRHPVVTNIISDNTYVEENDNNSVYSIGIGIKKILFTTQFS